MVKLANDYFNEINCESLIPRRLIERSLEMHKAEIDELLQRIEEIKANNKIAEKVLKENPDSQHFIRDYDADELTLYPMSPQELLMKRLNTKDAE